MLKMYVIYISEWKEHWRIDAFQLWCWRRCLSVPWLQGHHTSQSSRKPTLNIHWEGWYWRWSPVLWSPDADSLEKTKGRRKWQQRMRWLDDIINSRDMNLSKLQEIMKATTWRPRVERTQALVSSGHWNCGSPAVWPLWHEQAPQRPFPHIWKWRRPQLPHGYVAEP